MTQKNNNGWTPERRAKQAEAIKKWKPWTKSTGPRTETGKTICARNAYKHGCRSRGALKLRAVMARHSRWLAGIVAASRLDLIRKIAAQKKNATNELMDRRASLRGAAEAIQTKKLDGRVADAPRNDRIKGIE